MPSARRASSTDWPRNSPRPPKTSGATDERDPDPVRQLLHAICFALNGRSLPRYCQQLQYRGNGYAQGGAMARFVKSIQAFWSRQGRRDKVLAWSGLAVAAVVVLAAALCVVFWWLPDLIARHDVGPIIGPQRVTALQRHA